MVQPTTKSGRTYAIDTPKSDLRDICADEKESQLSAFALRAISELFHKFYFRIKRCTTTIVGQKTKQIISYNSKLINQIITVWHYSIETNRIRADGVYTKLCLNL